jgi:hypothetical protein
MNGAITYEMLSAVIAALAVVGGAWFFIEKRIKEVEREADFHLTATRAELALLRETMLSRYVSVEQLSKLEERLVSELRELRRLWERTLKEWKDE